MDLVKPHLRSLAAASAAIALQAVLSAPLGWHDELPSVPTAVGILLAVAAGAAAGIVVGAAVGAAGWALNFAFVADGSLEALLALPAWVAAGAVAGLLAARLRERSRQRRLAESRLAALGSSAAEAMIRLDLDGNVTDWNPAATAMYGYSASEAAGRSLAELVAGPDGPERLEDALEAVRRGERVAGAQAVHRHKDGRPLEVAVSLVPTASRPGELEEATLVVRDVGEVLRMDEQLRELQAKHRALAEGLPLVTYVRPAEAGAHPDFISPSVDKLVGYSADEFLRDPGLFLRLVHPDDRERMAEERTSPPDATRRSRAEYRMVSRDGRTVWVHEEAAVVLGSDGQPLCVQGFLLDMTEAKTADRERARLRAAREGAQSDARDRQRRIDFVAEAADVLAASLDHSTTIGKVAALAVRELADWCVVDILEDDGSLVRVAAERAEPGSGVPDPAAEPEPDVREVVQQRRAELSESRMCVPLASRGRRSVGALTLIASGNRPGYTAHDLAWAQAVAGMLALAIDNARLYNEVAARADAERVLTYVGDAVFFLDQTGSIRLWNPAAEAITGLSAPAVLGRPASDAIPGWREVSDRVPVSPAREPARAEALPLETERGERWISISGVEFFGGTVYAFRDITETHRLDELQADFIATASHELRTPLAAVYGAAQTLRRHDFALDEAGRERFISMIVDESDRLGRIVNQILLANQLDVGRLDLETEPFDAAELIMRVVEAARTHAPQDITFDVVVSKPVVTVAADKDRVRQILVNLVENAIKYSPDGGRIELGAEPAEAMVRFRVLDEGIGIPTEELPRIFEKFYRLDPDMLRGIGGTGLGLYICSELVGRMGGRIWVEQRAGRGSAFFFELPSAGPRAVVRAEEPPAAERVG
jgi:two-component system phosphate regulon sensor histidine kinase PhoR